MPVDRIYKAGIIIDHALEQDVVISPGALSPDVIDRFERFDVLSLTWTTKAPMLHPRAGHQQFTYLDSIIALGGTDGSEILKTVEEYSIPDDNWSKRASMQTPRCFFSAAQDGQYIYCIGGVISDARGNTTTTNSVERYNAVTDTWTTMAPLPLGSAFAVSHIVNGKIYVLSGYADTLVKPSSSIFIYTISTNTWDQVTLTDAKDLNLYRRLYPFSFVKDNYIYVLDGYLYELDNTQKPPVESSFFMYDSYRINTAGLAIERSDRFFENLPTGRYGGCTASINNDHYFLGGINNTSNTLRYFESINTSTLPFDYDAFSKLVRGRSSFACSPYASEYGTAIYSGGGVISKKGENFLKVELDAIPSLAHLNGKETVAINIRCTDENGDSPAQVNVRLSTSNAPVLFVNDQITVKNGYGMATLLPRADDGAGGSMQNEITRGYGITVKGAIIDPSYFGETDSLPPSPLGNGPNVTGGGTRKLGVFTDDIKTLTRYDSIVHDGQETKASFVGNVALGGIVSLSPVNSRSGKDTSLSFIGTQPWIPVFKSPIDDNGGTYARMIEALDRISRQEPFGGSAIMDSLMGSLDIMEFDVTGAKKLVYLQTDGEENNSNATATDVISRANSISVGKLFPIVSSVYRVVPSHLHLDQGIRDGSAVVEQLASQTSGSTNYVVSDEDVDRSIRTLLISNGFIGSGLFTCEIDLGDEVRIESISAKFNLFPETEAFWRYSIGNRERNFSILSDRVNANEVLSIFETEGRYIKFVAEFFAEMTTDTYNATKITPPTLTSIEIVYHKKTVSYIYLKPTVADAQVHNAIVSLDAQQSRSNSINVGVTSAISTTWSDFSSPAQPAADNGTRIVIPIRKALNERERFSLEPLVSIDGFIFEAKYGKWSFDSVVKIYNESGTEITTGFRAFPDKGFIVFDQRRTDKYIIEIANTVNLSVAAEITNRVVGEPVVITGAGYMYSTTAPKSLSVDASNILPEAINLLLLPLNPNSDSIFRANYTYYDISGRAEKGTVIKWYVNNTLEPDITGLSVWDNREWKFAKSGDTLYFTVQPKADGISGRVTRSVPIRLS
jgi:hypothetical protein